MTGRPGSVSGVDASSDLNEPLQQSRSLSLFVHRCPKSLSPPFSYSQSRTLSHPASKHFKIRSRCALMLLTPYLSTISITAPAHFQPPITMPGKPLTCALTPRQETPQLATEELGLLTGRSPRLSRVSKHFGPMGGKRNAELVHRCTAPFTTDSGIRGTSWHRLMYTVSER